MKGLRNWSHTFLTLLAASLIGPAPTSAASSALSAEPVVIQKAQSVISDQTREILVKRDPVMAKVWVFFTDKGVFDAKAFDAQAK